MKASDSVSNLLNILSLTKIGNGLGTSICKTSHKSTCLSPCPFSHNLKTSFGYV
jgi:hypothetical protein